MNLLRVPLAVTLLTGLLLSGGCSWRNLATYTASIPAELRVTSSYEVEVGHRFLISRDAPVTIDNHHGVSPDVLAAAYRGLALVFPASGANTLQSDSVLLRIDWPDAIVPRAERQRFVGASVLGFVEVPRLAQVEQLPVLVLDVEGGLIASAALQVSPSLTGREWPDLEVVERSFAELAERLRDG